MQATELSLSHLKAHADVVFTVIWRPLNHALHLKTLCLARCMIGDSGLAQLAGLLSTTYTLERLQLQVRIMEATGGSAAPTTTV